MGQLIIRPSMPILAIGVAVCLGFCSERVSGAPPVGCGDTITRDTTLHVDLGPCPGDGLVIGATGIMLDLNGHTISSAGSTEAFTAGVNNGGGYDGVTIKSGTVEGFVNPGGGPFSAGVVLTRADDNLVRDLRVKKNFRGIVAEDSDRVRFSSNKVNFNSPYGIFLDQANEFQVVHNSLNGGALVLGDSSHGLVKDNLVRAAPIRSISLGDSNRNRIVENRVTRVDAYALTLAASDHNVISRNELRAGLPSNHGLGIDFAFGSDANTLRHNAARHFDIGIAVGGPHTGGLQRRNLVADNSISRSGIGIAVGRRHAAHTRIKSNRANDNEKTGITIRKRTTVVTDNVARRNGGHGIAAVRGTHDGGGNIATHNRTPPQCVNISCS